MVFVLTAGFFPPDSNVFHNVRKFKNLARKGKKSFSVGLSLKRFFLMFVFLTSFPFYHPRQENSYSQTQTKCAFYLLR